MGLRYFRFIVDWIADRWVCAIPSRQTAVSEPLRRRNLVFFLCAFRASCGLGRIIKNGLFCLQRGSTLIVIPIFVVIIVIKIIVFFVNDFFFDIVIVYFGLFQAGNEIAFLPDTGRPASFKVP